MGKKKIYYDFQKRASEEEITASITAVMERVGIDPALIYATRKTGMMVTEMNLHRWSKRDLKKWDNAIKEYYMIRHAIN